MRLCRFDDDRLGVVDGPIIRDVTAALDVLPMQAYPFPTHDVLVEHLDRVVRACSHASPSAHGRGADASRCSALSRIRARSSLLPSTTRSTASKRRTIQPCTGTIRATRFTIHNAGLFLKATSSLVGPGQGVVIRRPDRRTDHEVELVIVIGKRATVSRVTMRWRMWPATRSGSTSRFAAPRTAASASRPTATRAGPWLVTADEIPEPGRARPADLRQRRTRQQSNTRHMLLGLPS